MVKPEQVVAGVWWLRGIRGSNVFLLSLPGGDAALVDCGAPGSAGAIERAIRASGVAHTRVRTLLLTHRHVDHAGSAAALRRRLGLTIVAGAGDVHDGHLRAHPGRLLGGRRPPLLPVDVVLPMDRDSEPLPGVIAIPAPGHTAGSVCYLLPERELMLIGDVALHSGDRMSRPLTIANEDTAAQERSLRAIAARAPRHGAPGHGDPLVGTFGARIRALAARPPAPGPWWLRVLLNPRQMWRFVRRSGGAH